MSVKKDITSIITASVPLVISSDLVIQVLSVISLLISITISVLQIIKQFKKTGKIDLEALQKQKEEFDKAIKNIKKEGK